MESVSLSFIGQYGVYTVGAADEFGTLFAAAKAIFNQLSIAAQQIKLANELHVMGEVWMIDKLGASIVRKAPAAHKH